MGEMFVKGVSTTKVGQVIETLTGSHPSASTVSRVFHTIEGEYEQWKTRKLSERYVYAFADGTYFTVIYNNEGCKMPILAVVGIAETGEREVLAFSVGDRENEQAWKDEARKTSNNEGSKPLTSGSAMATRRCSMPSRSSSRTPLVSAVWFIRWTMCSVISPLSSKSSSNRNCEPCSTRKIGKPLIRPWLLLSKNTDLSTRPPLRVCSAIWRPV
jgi:hypothetical protein